MITSFHLHRLPLVRALAPEIAIGALVWGRTRAGQPMTPAEMVTATRRAAADVMLIWHEYLDAAVAAAGREATMPVGAAGGDAGEADMRRLIDLGVVRMTANYPDILRRVVDEMRPAQREG
jgi:hypothetical protein